MLLEISPDRSKKVQKIQTFKLLLVSVKSIEKVTSTQEQVQKCDQLRGKGTPVYRDSVF